MATISPSVQALARRLLAVEGARTGRADRQQQDEAAARVVEKLRHSLTELAGPAGFAAILSRALALARADVDLLHQTKVQPDGTLEGFAPGADGADAVALIGHLLELMVTFIGEPVTLILLGDIWPDESLDG